MIFLCFELAACCCELGREGGPRAVGAASTAGDLWKYKSLPFPIMLVLMLLCSQKDNEDNLSKNCESN